MKRSYNYPYYKKQRSDNTKIFKSDLYAMLDKEDVLRESLQAKKVRDDDRYKKNCEYLDKIFSKE